MTNEQQQIREWMKKFGQETPEKPIIPSLEVRKLRAKLILEEALETIEALGFMIYLENEDGEWDNFVDCFNPEKSFNEVSEPSLEKISDGCTDLKVVTEGTLVACGLVSKKHFKADSGGCQINEYDPFFNEVMRSNFSKLWTKEEIDKQFILAREFEFKKGWNSEATLFCEQVSVAPEKWLVKDKDGKVIKSPSYSPANLQPIIDEMGK